jgi:CCR4-NOT complex subunit CAF16
MAEKNASAVDGAIRVSGMQFSYDVQDPIFFDFNLDLPAGSRCLLVGANGSGKNYSNHFDFVCVSVSVNLK